MDFSFLTGLAVLAIIGGIVYYVVKGRNKNKTPSGGSSTGGGTIKPPVRPD